MRSEDITDRLFGTDTLLIFNFIFIFCLYNSVVMSFSYHWFLFDALYIKWGKAVEDGRLEDCFYFLKPCFMVPKKKDFLKCTFCAVVKILYLQALVKWHRLGRVCNPHVSNCNILQRKDQKATKGCFVVVVIPNFSKSLHWNNISYF